ncbi:hypothetical protein KIN20_016244 [Parelaphostrongylus tenuis]|uniref:Palmitoyltransferase n=1 Tax=Parelaphostrongylus tenuis TaxID=148309 RepID=A0AAD5MH61_PARTN|nr:hypothetical protein KIN20_016244 [Parelaphostrongylus tenuis]
MGLWSLFAALIAGVAKIPQKLGDLETELSRCYGSMFTALNVNKVSPEVDAKLKECTPCENGKYLVDKSTTEQTVKQHRILTKAAKDLGVVQAECDQAGRNKYCYMCMALKPDRTHHCSSCGRCVVKFDHHCPWINQCVNHANYKQFLLYILYSTLTIVWFLLTSSECFVRFVLNANWLEESIPLSLLLIVMVAYGVFGYYPLGEMLIFHFGLVSLNETTCEQAKPSVLKFDFKADYNLGRGKNFKQVFGWGLWLFPLNTSFEDGMHFEIRYVEPTNQMRFKRVIVSSNKDEATGNKVVLRLPLFEQRKMKGVS